MITLIQIIQPDAATYGECIDRDGLPVASKLAIKRKLAARKFACPSTQREALCFLDNDYTSQEVLLDKIFAWFNAGSGEECQEFLAAGMRSLSVGDYVAVRELDDSCIQLGTRRDYIYRCDSKRWTEVSWTQMEREIDDWMIKSRKQGKETA